MDEQIQYSRMSKTDRDELDGVARVHLEMPVEPIADSADIDDLLTWAADAIISFRAGLMLTYAGHPDGGRILYETALGTRDGAELLSARVLAKSLVGDVEAMLREREL